MYEDLPKYCLSCLKVGHSEAECGLLSKNPVAVPSLPKQQWILKNKAVDSTVQKQALVSTVNKDSIEATSSAAISFEVKTNSVLASTPPLVEMPTTSASVLVENHIVFAPTSAADNVPMAATAAELVVDAVVTAAPPAVSPMLAEDSQLLPIAELNSEAMELTHTLDKAVQNAEAPYVVEHPLIDVSASSSAPSSLPKAQGKSYADILLGAKQPGSPSSVSIKPRFHAIKSAEYPSLPLPNFRIFFLARPLFPQDSLEEPISPRPAESNQMYSEGDDVPRQPIQRKKLSTSLRSSYQDFNAILKKGRYPEFYPVIRKKWKKLAPYSQPDPTSTTNTSTKNAPDSQEHPMAVSHEEDPGDDSLVDYESNWHSSTSDDEADINYENLLAFDEEYLPMDYSDFSFALPLQTRRKYNKRFRDLPPRFVPEALGNIKFQLYH